MAHRLLIAAFTVLGAISLFKIVVLFSIVVDQRALAYPVIANVLEDNPLIKGTYSLNWYVVLLTVEGVVGILYASAVIAFLGNRDRAAIQISSTALILSLTVTNTLSFYFNQFSVVLDSLLLAVVLLLLARYRARFNQISLRPPIAFQPLEINNEQG